MYRNIPDKDIDYIICYQPYLSCTIMIVLTALIFLTAYSTGKPTSSCNMEKDLFILMDSWKNRTNLDDKEKRVYLKDCDFFDTCKPDFECAEGGFNENLTFAIKSVGAQCKTSKTWLRP
ncbi:Protein CBG26914 [Caenorhabditis briggsae]|uniref:Protein CBG26914 n=1 Tax=Caenorhabditis briggsae TaxID=6238 RepID=B6IEQ7_CAEBR|nr:Protein CBG26914 [Caenorhabditis briggsae]CAR98387.1 Protein CBG26914 [Caenorhabditis briggsae]